MLPSIKTIFRPEYFKYFFAGSLLVFLASGCNTRIQGCLEVNAENFNLDAERPCDDCCTYPSMGLTLTQKWGDGNFTNTDTLFDLHGEPYLITDLRYFLTSWSWKDQAGELYTIDSVDADCLNGTLTYTPDVLVIDTRKFAYTLGSIRQAPALESVAFNLGLVEDFSCLDDEDPETPPELTDQSPLWNPETNRLEVIRLILRRNIESDDTDTVFLNTPMNVLLTYNAQMDVGIDFNMELSVDYARWFQDADVSNLSSFSSSILSHFDGSIFPTP